MRKQLTSPLKKSRLAPIKYYHHCTIICAISETESGVGEIFVLKVAVIFGLPNDQTWFGKSPLNPFSEHSYLLLIWIKTGLWWIFLRNVGNTNGGVEFLKGGPWRRLACTTRSGRWLIVISTFALFTVVSVVRLQEMMLNNVTFM